MQNILVTVDFSDVSEKILELAATVAAAFSSKLWLIHVAAPDPDFVGYHAGPEVVMKQRADTLRREHRWLQGQADALCQRGIETTALLVQGPTVETILREAQRLEVDLIVIGSHGRGMLSEAILGSVSRDVLRQATCPVLTVPPS